MHYPKNLPDLIKGVLSDRHPNSIRDGQPPKYKHAGVLIPLFEEEGIFKVLFTKRSNMLENHKGQISFPGGAVGEEDRTVEETALREAQEEVGILRDDVKILGRTDDVLTLVSYFVLHPFVGLIPYPYEFSINQAEVRRLIKVPLLVFDPRNPEAKKNSATIEGVTYNTVAYEYEDDLIWGATARAMENFMDIIQRKIHLS